ncbi:MAG: hypothetical protein LKJ60_01555 [Lentilactobacillus buchneri]|nr:hypothetical protein [Lentilactobacillus buchneri]
MLKIKETGSLTQKNHISPAEHYKLNKRIRGIFTTKQKDDLLKTYKRNKKLASFQYHG